MKPFKTYKPNEHLRRYLLRQPAPPPSPERLPASLRVLRL